jgi:hypothetical protein
MNYCNKTPAGEGGSRGTFSFIRQIALFTEGTGGEYTGEVIT